MLVRARSCHPHCSARAAASARSALPCRHTLRTSWSLGEALQPSIQGTRSHERPQDFQGGHEQVLWQVQLTRGGQHVVPPRRVPGWSSRLPPASYPYAADYPSPPWPPSVIHLLAWGSLRPACPAQTCRTAGQPGAAKSAQGAARTACAPVTRALAPLPHRRRAARGGEGHEGAQPGEQGAQRGQAGAGGGAGGPAGALAAPGRPCRTAGQGARATLGAQSRILLHAVASLAGTHVGGASHPGVPP